jgi:hypothetical protein
VRTLIASMTVALVLAVPVVGFPQTRQLPAGAPVVYQGVPYFPSGPTVFFDGAIMVRVGTFRGIPLYVDPTTNPISVVLVPIGGKLMRPYDWQLSEVELGLVYPPAPDFPDGAFDDDPPFVGVPQTTFERFAPTLAPTGGGVPVVRGPAGRGMWIEFGGRMWTPVGPGPERGPRLRMVGDYHGFAVFQEPGRPDRILVPSTAGGPLVEYDRRRE